jgi:hypothetical protein
MSKAKRIHSTVLYEPAQSNEHPSADGLFVLVTPEALVQIVSNGDGCCIDTQTGWRDVFAHVHHDHALLKLSQADARVLRDLLGLALRQVEPPGRMRFVRSPEARHAA